MNEPFYTPVRQEFGETQITSIQETAASAVAAQAKAMVESRYIIAMRCPRNWDEVRQKIMHECRRPSFANNKSAYYHKPIGKGVEGLGIRFVEVALRYMRNVLVETTMVFEDDSKEIHRITVTDLESNLTYPLDVRVSKTVERSKPMDDGSFISVRKNSYDKLVYTVPANDDDLLNKRGALISKAIRTLGSRIIPGDIQDEAEMIIKSVRLNEAAKDPGAERKRIADAFADIGVMVVDLVSFLGHGLDTCSPAELVNLRGIYGAIKDGEATWNTVMENKTEQTGKTGDNNGENKNKPTIHPITPENFEKKKAQWKALIESGKKTVNDLIAMIQTKELLSNDQKTEIASWLPQQTKGEQQ